MNVYSIKDLEHLSGIKAHTIRIWEQRYELFSPQRTQTNIRFYNEEDLKLILNISSLKNHGFKISKIVGMPHEAICKEVQRINFTSKSYEDQIHSLTISMIDMDEKKFTEILNQNIGSIGFEKTMMDIIYPFMRKIGILWITNAINPAQEHFISHLVRQKLITATDALEANEEGPLFLLFLPEGELHELGILFANYLLRSQGMRTIFFGQSVPLSAIEEVFHKLNPDYILTAMTTAPAPSEVQHYVSALGKRFKDVQVLITGSQIVGNDIQCASNIKVIKQFQDLELLVNNISKTWAIA